MRACLWAGGSEWPDYTSSPAAWLQRQPGPVVPAAGSEFSEDHRLCAGRAVIFAAIPRQLPLKETAGGRIQYFLAYNNSLRYSYLWRTLIPMGNTAEQKKPGRPALPPEQKRTGRLSMRTYPDVEEKARRVGTEAVEQAIRAIKEPK